MEPGNICMSVNCQHKHMYLISCQDTYSSVVVAEWATLLHNKNAQGL